MKQDDVTPFLGKHVRLIRSDGFRFHGQVTTVNDLTLTFLDRYNQRLVVSLDSVSAIEELSD